MVTKKELSSNVSRVSIDLLRCFFVEDEEVHSGNTKVILQQAKLLNWENVILRIGKMSEVWEIFWVVNWGAVNWVENLVSLELSRSLRKRL